MKSIKQIKKEVKDDLNKCLEEVKITGKSEPESLPFLKEDKLEKIYENMEKDFQKEKKIVSKMNSQQIANWLIDKHTGYVKMLESTTQCDFLNERDPYSRYYLLVYISELYNLLSAYEIDFFSKDVVDILVEQKECELISILNALNYL